MLSFGQYEGALNGNQSWTNTEYNTTEGTEFWVTFMSNSGAAEGDMETMKLYLYVSSREKAQVTFYNPNNNESSSPIDIPAGQQIPYQVPNEWAYINTKEANSVIPTCLTDAGVVVYATEFAIVATTEQNVTINIKKQL